MATIRQQDEFFGGHWCVYDDFGQCCGAWPRKSQAIAYDRDPDPDHHNASLDVDDSGYLRKPLESWTTTSPPPQKYAIDPVSGQSIKMGLARIEKALVDSFCTASNPCVALAYYDRGIQSPWRIADDGYSENYASLEEAISAASDWDDQDA